MATNMPPHNITEIIDGIIKVIDEPETSIVNLMEIIHVLIFLQVESYMVKAVFLARIPLVKTYQSSCKNTYRRKRKKRLIVTELPYQVNKSKSFDNIADLVKNKKIEESLILEMKATVDGMRIVIELKRDAIEDVVINQLFGHTEMQSTFGILTLR